MHPRSPVDTRRQGRGGTGQREVSLRRLLLLLMVVCREGRVGMMRHRHRLLRLVVVVVVLLLVLLLVLLVELGLHVVVLGFVLEVLEMLPMGPVVLLLVVVEVLWGRRRRSSVLAHDAAVGSLWVVEEGGHHGGGTNKGGGEAWLRVLCVGVGEWLAVLGARVGVKHRG